MSVWENVMKQETFLKFICSRSYFMQHKIHANTLYADFLTQKNKIVSFLLFWLNKHTFISSQDLWMISKLVELLLSYSVFAQRVHTHTHTHTAIKSLHSEKVSLLQKSTHTSLKYVSQALVEA